MTTKTDSELTAKAREVLAGLSEPQRRAMSDRDPCYGWLVAHGRTQGKLHDLCLFDWPDARTGYSKPCLTDLGREVARLLSEVHRG